MAFVNLRFEWISNSTKKMLTQSHLEVTAVGTSTNMTLVVKSNKSNEFVSCWLFLSSIIRLKLSTMDFSAIRMKNASGRARWWAKAGKVSLVIYYCNYTTKCQGRKIPAEKSLNCWNLLPIPYASNRFILWCLWNWIEKTIWMVLTEPDNLRDHDRIILNVLVHRVAHGSDQGAG